MAHLLLIVNTYYHKLYTRILTALLGDSVMNTTSTKIDTVEKIIQNVVNYLSQHGEMRTAGGLSGKVLQGEY